ncbi:AI-2E family transporter [Methanothermococcus sp. SCGC AD-155-K20]|nr:AI-2E family transporter [Methanothermococcus sp. SCGC AD-155-K20]
MDNWEFKMITRVFVLMIFLFMVYLIYPFFDAIALSCAFAYMGRPIYDLIKPYMGKSLAAIICLLVFIVPTVIVGLIALMDLVTYLSQIDIQNLQNLNIINLLNYKLHSVSSIFGYSWHINEDTLMNYIFQIWAYFEPHIKGLVSQIMIVPMLIIKVMMILFMTYYLLKDGDMIKKVILSHVPDKFHQKTEVFLDKLNESYKNLFIGNALTSIAIGVISGVGYYILGVPNAFILAVITGIFALLPIVGGWTIYMPLSLYYLIMGEALKGVGLFIFGALFLSIMPDFVIRPLIVKNESDIHPSLVLIAFLIGPLTLGIGGFAIGPLIVGVFDALCKTKLNEEKLLGSIPEKGEE